MTLAAIISAVSALITSVALLVTALGTFRRMKTVHRAVTETLAEVKTANSLSMANLADAEETRRVEKIPERLRTDVEKEHIGEIPAVKRPHP